MVPESPQPEKSPGSSEDPTQSKTNKLILKLSLILGTSLADQWLKLCAPTARGTGSTCDQGTKDPAYHVAKKNVFFFNLKIKTKKHQFCNIHVCQLNYQMNIPVFQLSKNIFYTSIIHILN